MILVRIKGIKGDVQIDGYDEWFVVQSMSFGVGRDVEASKDKRSQDIEIGRTDIQALQLDKTVDTATVYLMHAAMQARTKAGGHGLGIDIHLIQTRELNDDSGKNKPIKPFMKIRIENAIIKEWNIDASEDDRPNESLTVWFNRAAMKYRASIDANNYQTHGPLGWDQQRNEEWKSDTLMKNDE